MRQDSYLGYSVKLSGLGVDQKRDKSKIQIGTVFHELNCR